MFANRLLRNLKNVRVPRRWLMHPKSILGETSITKAGINDAIDESEEILYPALNEFNVTTVNQVHSFSIPCDRVIKIIKLGAVNRSFAAQYCHYIAHLSRTSNDDDSAIYSKRCLELWYYINRHHKELPDSTKIRLLCDVADTCSDNCVVVCNQILQNGLSGYGFSQLLSSCYKFGLWELAQLMLELNGGSKLIRLKTIDPLVQGIVAASNRFKELENIDKEKQNQLRNDVRKHLITFLEKCYSIRVQFATSYTKEFIKSLEDFNINVQVNPRIKQSGRCTCCNNHLPLFDDEIVPKINSAVRELLMKGSDKGLYLNASPNDNNRFQSFLKDIHARDKRPIDCVLDGLNIAYRNSLGTYFIKKQINENVQKTIKRRDPEAQVQILINSILRGNLLNQYKKILVVGKYHMSKWPGLMEFFEKHNIHFYCSYNHSKDDLYQIYASTLSPKTLLFTGDYLRDHLAQLDPDVRNLFERWIDTHQVWIENRTLKPIMPTPYEKLPTVQNDGKVFHVPVIDKNALLSADDHEPPPHLNKKMITWLCCQIKE